MSAFMANKKRACVGAHTLLGWRYNFGKRNLHPTVYQNVWDFSIKSHTDSVKSVQKSHSMSLRSERTGVRCIPTTKKLNTEGRDYEQASDTKGHNL